jgi:acylphosphatase
VNTDLASLQAIVYGRVQGVFFRAFVTRCARKLGLVGYVRNLPDGAVEVGVEGERQHLEKLISYLEVGPTGAKVKEVVTRWSEYTGAFSDFRVRY